LVEHELPKLGVAGSNPVARSIHPVTSVLLDIYQGRRFQGRWLQGKWAADEHRLSFFILSLF
jgi:hypothetical protein